MGSDCYGPQGRRPHPASWDTHTQRPKGTQYTWTHLSASIDHTHRVLFPCRSPPVSFHCPRPPPHHTLSPRAYSPAYAYSLTRTHGPVSWTRGRNLGPPQGASCTDVLSHLNLIQAGGRAEGLTSALTAALCLRASIWATACPRQSQQRQHNSILRGFVSGRPGSEPGKGVHSFSQPRRRVILLLTSFRRWGKPRHRVQSPAHGHLARKERSLAAWLQSLGPQPGNRAPNWSGKALP